jgi:hypothetical protein
MNITYSECVFVALGIRPAMRMRHIVICSLHRCTAFFHLFTQTARFSKESHSKQNVCFDFLYSFCLKYFLVWEKMSEIWSKTCIGLRVKCLLLLSDFNEIWFLTDFAKKILKYKISWKPVQWEPSCCMRRDGHDEANSRLSQICECA